MKIFFGIILFVFAQTIAQSRELSESERILKQTILYKIGDNYIQNAFWAGGKIIRWNKAYFPIKVYAENGLNVPNYYATSFIKAAQIWQNEIPELIKIAFVSDENIADIVFKITKKKEYIRKVSDNESQTLAYTEPVIKNNKLEKMYIFVNERNINGSYYMPYEILNIAVHEFGHALGISGHPYDNKSVMYALYNPKTEKHTAFLNNKDKNTILLLYKMTPDITNKDKSKEKDTLDAELLAGTNSERLDISIKSSIDEIKIKSKDCASYIKLAALYEQKHDYEKMYKVIQMAEPLVKTNDELYAVHIGYASYFYSKKDKKSAKYHILKALEVNNNKAAKDFLNDINRL